MLGRLSQLGIWMQQGIRIGNRTRQRAPQRGPLGSPTPQANEVFDTSNIGFGFGIEKLHRAVFNEIRAHDAEADANVRCVEVFVRLDEIRAHDAEALRLRAGKLPPNDPRRLAFQHSRTDKSSVTGNPTERGLMTSIMADHIYWEGDYAVHYGGPYL